MNFKMQFKYITRKAFASTLLCVLIFSIKVRAINETTDSHLFGAINNLTRATNLFHRYDLDGQNTLAVPTNLPEISSSTNLNSKLFIEATAEVFGYEGRRFEKRTVSNLAQMTLISIAQSSAYKDIFMHRYDNYEDVKRASGPDVNNEQCLRQLENMLTRVERIKRKGYSSKDVNMFRILDSWGQRPTSLLRGNLFDEGNYDECSRLKLELGERKRVDLRYCVASVKLDDWKPVDKHDILEIKTGVCIPSACDSLKYKNKYDLIRNIGNIGSYRMRSVGKGLALKGLHCLPDEKSEFRSIWHAPKALAALICFTAWISLQIFATYKCHRPGASSESAKSKRLEIYRMLSITNNMRTLFDTTKKSPAKGQNVDDEKVASEQQNSTTSEQESELAPNSEATVDLRCIEGIKVVAMCYIIIGHVLMCLPTMMRNSIDLGELGLSFKLANMVPAYAVNSFFAITGLLTSYLMFKQNKSQRVITSPAKWLALLLYRYLRIMPMYALVVLYCKTLAKYTGSGPLWDYGTSALSQRRLCEQEPWSWTLTFTSNFLPPVKHCVPGGWYLSNDFQFFLITPFLMALLHLKPQLGKMLLYAGIAASYIAGFVNIYNADPVDMRPIANFAPSGFKTYVSHMSANYTYPQYRIPAYLIGLLIGFKLYQLENNNKEQRSKLTPSEQSKQTTSYWSATFKNYGSYHTTALFVLFGVTPFLGSLLPFDKFTARLMVALVNPSYHLMFGLNVGMFIMLAATGRANKQITRILSASFWKPLARLSLCAVLVNVEVINHIIQTRNKQIDIHNSSHMLLNCVCIAATYFISTIVYVLFETPVKNCLSALVIKLINRLGARQKID